MREMGRAGPTSFAEADLHPIWPASIGSGHPPSDPAAGGRARHGSGRPPPDPSARWRARHGSSQIWGEGEGLRPPHRRRRAAPAAPESRARKRERAKERVTEREGERSGTGMSRGEEEVALGRSREEEVGQRVR